MLSFLSVIAKDKLLHFLVGAVIFAVLYPLLGTTASIIVVLAIAVCKELFDATGRGTPEFYDIVATVLGGAFMGVAHWWML